MNREGLWTKKYQKPWKKELSQSILKRNIIKNDMRAKRMRKRLVMMSLMKKKLNTNENPTN
jgi:hypothetical protein